MNEQLLELFQMQEELDLQILGDKPYPEQQMQVALIVELGELMNEFPSKFKHWKKEPTDNREKGLEEYVDCLHFMISLAIYRNLYDDIEDNDTDYNECDDWNDYQYGTLLENIITYSDEAQGLWWLFSLGNLLGFTWEEIYNEYKLKNAINYQRQEEGY